MRSRGPELRACRTAVQKGVTHFLFFLTPRPSISFPLRSISKQARSQPEPDTVEEPEYSTQRTERTALFKLIMASRNLSEEEIADLKEAFSMFDIDGDGK